MSNWIDKHSVSCFLCQEIFDERDGVKFFPEGEICPKCQKLKFVICCDNCGFAMNKIDILNTATCPNCKMDITQLT